MTVAVYCGSEKGNENYVAGAQEVGQWIGKSGYDLVYGGGTAGLMGEVSREAKENGAKVVGVVPFDVPFIADRPQPYCDEVIKTKNMSERKATMLKMADVFVALPGGIGTLDEISEAVTLTKIGVMDKKAVFFNKNGFYEPLKQMFLKMIEVGFMKEKDLCKVCFAENIEQIEEFVKRL
ncbi:MAG: TIGR00730 family Rossman fold protein [Treponema sp.]|nr:TIGR00730 family Rossman fold protein [Treponema sp.]